MRIRLLCLSSLLAMLSLAPNGGLVADVVVLRDGGELRGEFLDNQFAHKTADLKMRTVTGAIVTVPRSEIASLTRRRLVYEQYEVRRRNAADTFEGQWELAEWCRANDLRDRRQTHLRRILDFQPDHVEARRVLGYKLVEGRWLTQDEIMTARGYVKYKGRYMLPQELELLVQEQKETEAEKGWYRKVRLWYGWVNDARPERQNEGLSNLRAIRDPNAVPALYRTLAGDKNENARLLYVAVLTNINDDRVLGPLVTQSLQDESTDVRHAAVQGVAKVGSEKALPVYVQALRNDANVIVNRAGYALGEVTRKQDWPNVLPQLMGALVTTHRYKVRVMDRNQGISMRTDGALIPNGLLPIPPDIAVMLATGQLPDGIQIQEVQPPGIVPATKLVTVHKEHQNAGVLAALTKLTGEDFGHNVVNWRAWWSTDAQQRAPQAAAR